MLESENDRMEQELSSKVGALKSVSSHMIGVIKQSESAILASCHMELALSLQVK
jgi:hypothetical protein